MEPLDSLPLGTIKLDGGIFLSRRGTFSLDPSVLLRPAKLPNLVWPEVHHIEDILPPFPPISSKWIGYASQPGRHGSPLYYYDYFKAEMVPKRQREREKLSQKITAREERCESRKLSERS